MLGNCSEELSADDALAAKVEAMATQIVAAEGAASVADTVFVAEIRFEVRKLGFPHEAGTAVAANVAGVAARECCDVRAAGEFTWELVSTVRSSGVSEYPPQRNQVVRRDCGGGICNPVICKGAGKRQDARAKQDGQNDNSDMHFALPLHP